jgi:hypothetical protein
MEVEELSTPKRKRKEKNPGYSANKKLKHTDDAEVEIEKNFKTKGLRINFQSTLLLFTFTDSNELGKNPSLPDHYETDAWKTLLSAILAVYDKQAISITKEELYRVFSLL